MNSILGLLLLLPLLIPDATGYALSCDDVMRRIINRGLSPYPKYLCVVPQENFTNWAELEDMRVLFYSMSFADVGKLPTKCIKNYRSWRFVSGSAGILDCSQKFSIILSEIEPTILTPVHKVQEHSLNFGNSVFVSPRTGVKLQTKRCMGAGTVSVFAGVGSGEAEDKYLLRSWPCTSIPDVIVLIDTIITVHLDEGVTYDVQYSSTPYSSLTAGPAVKMVVIASGHSEGYCNIQVENGENRDIDVKMKIALDPNKESVFIQKQSYGQRLPFSNGIHTLSFASNYTEIRYIPQIPTRSDTWRIQDNAIIDISIGPDISHRREMMLERALNAIKEPKQCPFNITVSQVKNALEVLLNLAQSPHNSACFPAAALILPLLFISTLLIYGVVCVIMRRRQANKKTNTSARRETKSNNETVTQTLLREHPVLHATDLLYPNFYLLDNKKCDA